MSYRLRSGSTRVSAIGKPARPKSAARALSKAEVDYAVMWTLPGAALQVCEVVGEEPNGELAAFKLAIELPTSGEHTLERSMLAAAGQVVSYGACITSINVHADTRAVSIECTAEYALAANLFNEQRLELSDEESARWIVRVLVYALSQAPRVE